MPDTSYLTRNDVGSLHKIPRPQTGYAIKIIENKNLGAPQDAVNAYLLALPSVSGTWEPSITNIQYDSFSDGKKKPKITHLCVITIYAIGTINTPPTG